MVSPIVRWILGYVVKVKVKVVPLWLYLSTVSHVLVLIWHETGRWIHKNGKTIFRKTNETYESIWQTRNGHLRSKCWNKLVLGSGESTPQSWGWAITKSNAYLSLDLRRLCWVLSRTMVPDSLRSMWCTDCASWQNSTFSSTAENMGLFWVQFNQ